MQRRFHASKKIKDSTLYSIKSVEYIDLYLSLLEFEMVKVLKYLRNVSLRKRRKNKKYKNNLKNI